MELKPGVHQLQGAFGGGILGVNVFLLVDNKLTLVDTGIKGQSQRILLAIRGLGYSPSDVGSIIVTHHHLDHTGNLATLKRITGATVMAHASDAPYISGSLADPGPAKPTWRTQLLGFMQRAIASEPAIVDQVLGEGDELPVLGGLRILHVPGHTEGSIALFLPDRGLLLTGDIISNRSRLGLPSREYTVDMAREIGSVKRLASLDFDSAGFGHGRPILHGASAVIAAFASGL
jgi:glyoxylase-like metal-dependent hydrolase (beta-lactamase superfamily II)